MIQKAAFRFLYWLALLLSHKTIAVSDAARKQIRNWPYVQDKISVIHNGIGLETGFSKANARLELTRSHPELKKALDGIPESSIVWVGTVAELHPVKGYGYSIKAVSDCVQSLKNSDPRKKALYTILGEGKEKERLQSLIKELKLEDTVFLMGHIDRAAEYVKAFDIFLLASISEGLGYVLLEAGAASLPVLATTVGGIPEVIDDMESGILVQPRNARELAHALMFMIEHPAERRGYGTALKEKVVKEFSLGEMVRRTQEVYTHGK